MIKRKLLTAALVAVLALSMAGCSSISSQAKSDDHKSLFEVSSSKDKEKDKDDDEDKDDRKDDRDDEDEEEEDEKDDRKDEKDEEKDDRDDEDEKDDKKDDRDDEDEEDEKDDRKDDKDDEKEDEKDDDDEDSSEMSVKEMKKELGDDLTSGKFGIDGVIYELPAKVSDFEKHGWEIDERNTDKYLDSNRGGRVILAKGDKMLYLYGENYDDYTINTEDATITDATVGEDYRTDMYLPLGIDSTMKKDEIKEILEDNNIDYAYDDDSSYVEMFSMRSNDASVVIGTSKENDKVSQMGVTAYISNESKYQGAPEANVEVADEEDIDIDYTAPKKIKDITDFEIDGDLYSMRAPVSAFLDNGWELEEGVNTDNQIEAGGMGSAIITKGKMRVQLHVDNEANARVSIKNAIVTDISSRDNCEFKLWGGIESGQEAKAVKKVLDSEDINYDDSSDRSISFSGEDRTFVYIGLDDDGEVSSFSIDVN